MIGRRGGRGRTNQSARNPGLRGLQGNRGLCGREMTNLAIRRCRGVVVSWLDVDRTIGMLVMAKVCGDLDSLVLAIACRRSKRSLERNEHQQEEGDETSHALRIMPDEIARSPRRALYV